ncbi:MAG TPA: UDP-N-acetylmuramoyl-L-alanine--D-glutamate ligase [Bacteroidota bacterium]|nr:UDP-N-acetylmuramoyl-L-alanine--D-glutamate ligase [Bacteroidota bacterium]
MDITLLNRKISILGAAKSGVSVAKLIKSKGGIPFVSDSGDENKLKEYLQELEREKIDFEIGKHSEKVFDADFLVISPGVPMNNPVVSKFLENGKEVYSEIEIAFWFNKAKLIGITGSNGKTTTTTLLYRMFCDNKYKSFVAGNIGYPLSDYVLSSSEDSFGVLELSSFQLDNIKYFKPYISIIMNITPDHLDRYVTFENYINSKGRIFLNQDMNDYLIYNEDDEIVRNLIQSAKCKKLSFSIKGRVKEGIFVEDGVIKVIYNEKETEIIDSNKISIKGKHNLYNSMAASLAGFISGIKVEEIVNTLMNFEGVEHRLEFVKEINGVKFYNDSKATNVDSVWYALDSFVEPINLIAGGKDKGNDYSSISELVEKKVKNLIVIGIGAKKLFDYFKEKTNVVFADTMEDAVKKAYELAKPGEIVLLSPACASFDMFNNYEHRGQVFKQCVYNLVK